MPREPAGVETIVVDHGSTDGTVASCASGSRTVRVIEQENRGLGAGLNAGMRAVAARYHLLINSDAWLDDGALDRLVAFAEAHPDAAVVGPRLRNPDGTLQRSVRGFPTLWRLATEYFFIRKLAPQSRAMNSFYAGDFDHGSARAVDWAMGVVLPRPARGGRRGRAVRRGLLPVQRGDRLVLPLPRGRLEGAGSTPDAEAVHVGGASHGGRMFTENVRGHVRWFSRSTAAHARRRRPGGC